MNIQTFKYFKLHYIDFINIWLEEQYIMYFLFYILTGIAVSTNLPIINIKNNFSSIIFITVL